MRICCLHIILLISCLFFNTTQKAYCQEDTTHHNRISVGFKAGILNYSGDISNNNSQTALTSKIGIQFPVLEVKVNPSLSFRYTLLSGKVYGDEKSATRNLNFQSNITTQALTFSYDFSKFIGENAFLKPYVSTGISMVSFRTKSDLLSADGSTYYYWADGTIRDKSEKDLNAASAKIIERDYVYETSLRDLDLDKVGKYKQYCFAVPVEAGVKLRLSKVVRFDIGCSYIMPFSDYIDNISKESIGVRQGDSKLDKLLYISSGFVFNINIPRQQTPVQEEIKPQVPDQIATNIPKDKPAKTEPASEPKKEVKTTTEKPKTEPKTEPKAPVSKLPEYIKPFDTDKDDYISNKEVLNAIDRFFDKQGTATAKDIEKLKEFFKKQPGR